MLSRDPIIKENNHGPFLVLYSPSDFVMTVLID